jgi:hypothetical protein
MLQAMLLAHLLGDYVFQGDRIVAWKGRSLWGLLAHGAIVSAIAWLCSLLFALDWGFYALAIGATHTAIDVVRARLGKVKPGIALALFLLDQVAHLAIILAVVHWSGWLGPRPAETVAGRWLQEGNRIVYLMGYALLSMPAWVLVHFCVNGTGAVSKSLPGRPGERYVGILERVLIATFVVMGQFLAVPLVLAPRLAIDGPGSRVEGERIGYLGELLASVSLAVAVGLLLRGLA